MKDQLNRSHEIKTTTADYQKQIDAITDRKLQLDNIDTYADEALYDLVAVVDTVTAGYDQDPTIAGETGMERERRSFNYYGLDTDTVDSTLMHISAISDKTNWLDGYIQLLHENGGEESIPPDAYEQVIEPGSGSFEKKETVPRLKAILLLLMERYDIDVNPATSNPDEFRLLPGAVAKHWQRVEAYHRLDIPALNRVIVVCDEKDNKTFVFNRSVLLDEGVTPESLKDMTKNELKALIKSREGVGRGITYLPSTFMSHIASSLEDDVTALEGREDVKLLKPKADIKTDRITTTDIASELGIDRSLVGKWLKEHGEEALMQKPYAKARQSVPTYSPEVIRRMKTDVRIARIALTEVAPDDVVSVNEWSDHVGVHYKSVDALAREYYMPLGEFRFGSRKRIGRGLFTHDTKYLEDILTEKGHFSGAPQEGELTLPEVAKKIGKPYSSTKKLVDKLVKEDPSFGDLAWRKRKTPTKYASASQVAIIESTIRDGAS